MLDVQKDASCCYFCFWLFCQFASVQIDFGHKLHDDYNEAEIIQLKSDAEAIVHLKIDEVFKYTRRLSGLL